MSAPYPPISLDRAELARQMHDEYENLSQQVGWETQSKCRVSFDDLPEKNRAVMLYMADFVISRVKARLEMHK